jgi:hypothetical protein
MSLYAEHHFTECHPAERHYDAKGHNYKCCSSGSANDVCVILMSVILLIVIMMSAFCLVT